LHLDCGKATRDGGDEPAAFQILIVRVKEEGRYARVQFLFENMTDPGTLFYGLRRYLVHLQKSQAANKHSITEEASIIIKSTVHATRIVPVCTSTWMEKNVPEVMVRGNSPHVQKGRLEDQKRQKNFSPRQKTYHPSF
jgi:hypothetical protein